MRLLALACTVLLALGAGCGGDDDGGGGDGSTPGTDSGPGGSDGGGEMPDGGMVLPDGCVIQVEICGDRIDQNCDGRETPCGDSDMDGIEACRTGDDLTMCDCDDARPDVRPPFGGGVPGAPELCDGRDNDCNGRVDESAACCAGCADLDNRARADICLVDGTCDCSTEAGTGACPAGETCCMAGCTDLSTDVMNCGFCQSACTRSADRCVAGMCKCGEGPVCDLDYPCNSGTCG